METNLTDSVIISVVKGYDNFFSYADPRVQNLLLMNNPFPVVAICVTYIYVVLSLGPKLMADRKPFHLRGVLIVYNAAQTIFSAFLFWEATYHWYNHHGLFECIALDNPNSAKEIHMCHLYFLSKITELLDTIFFVLRKKDRHVSLLHVFHHAIMPLSVWAGMKFNPGGNLAFFGLPNLFVHFWMYLYYMLAAMGPQYQKYIWWKRHITQMQLTQFMIILLYTTIISCKCSSNKNLVVLILVVNVIFVVLFVDFYRKAYRQQKQVKAKENTEEEKCLKSKNE